MQYWLMKSEPDVWSIDQQQKAGIKGATWDGVKNYQAANNLKKMKKGDLCFFYHSNIGKEIVGIIEVIKTAFLDKTDKEGRFVAIQVKFKEKLKKPIKLEVIKNTMTNLATEGNVIFLGRGGHVILKDFTNVLADQTKDSKSTAMREFLAGLHEEDIYGTTEADRMTQELISVYEQETGMRLSEEQTKTAFDQMLTNRMGDEISAENRYGRDTMNVTDIFLGHYFNNGYYTPQWQQIMGRERVNRKTFIDTAVNMGLGTRQEVRKLRNKYEY